MFKFLKSIGTAFRVVEKFDRMIREFPNQRQKDFDYVKNYINSQPYDEIKVLDKRFQEKLTLKIDDTNFKELVPKYFDLYKNIFPNSHFDNDLVSKKIEDAFELKLKEKNEQTVAENYLQFYEMVIPNDTSQKIRQTLNNFIFYDFVNSKITDDEALSPTEINEIVLKAQELTIQEKIDEPTLREKYIYYIRNWEVDNGIFPNITPDYILEPNEFCVFRNDFTSVYETKLVTEKIRYGGASVRIKIMKGVYYNAGGYNVSSYKRETDVLVGSGKLNLTNQRLILKTNLKIFTIKLKDIVHLEPYSDGLVVSKKTGKPITLKNNDAIILYQYLTGIIRKYYSS